MVEIDFISLWRICLNKIFNIESFLLEYGCVNYRSLKRRLIMTSMFSSPLWHLILQADMISKAVLAILLFMSMLCWSVFLYKLFLLRNKKKHMKNAFDYIRQVGTMEDLALVTDKCIGTTPGHFLTYNIQHLRSLIELSNKQGAGKLGVAYWGQLQDGMYYTIDEMLYHEESLLWVLSTSAGAATLLGLFGTVWGLVHAFVNISQKQTADIATVAPGIAEALMTTLAGLMVAIPALIMFNYLSMQVRRIEQQLMSLAQLFNRIVQIMFVC